MVTDMVLSADERYVITADRDEHIRVSRYPNGYNIESFCLGHTEYVCHLSSVCLASTNRIFKVLLQILELFHGHQII